MRCHDDFRVFLVHTLAWAMILQAQALLGAEPRTKPPAGSSKPRKKSAPKVRPNSKGAKPGNENYAIEEGESRTARAVLTFEVQAPKLQADEWIVYFPNVPAIPGQSAPRTKLSPSTADAVELSPLKRPMILARLPVVMGSEQEQKLQLRVDIQAKLTGRHLVTRQPSTKYAKPSPLTAAEREAFLSATKWQDHQSPEFQKWITDQDLLRTTDEGEIDFARRVFLSIRNGFDYAYPPPVDRSASLTCASKSSDCGGLSTVFCGVLRANGIPARLQLGRWAKSAVEGESLGGKEYKQWHAKSQFYATGVGWVPVDVSAAVSAKNQSDGLHAFGHDEHPFLTMHIDTDLLLDSIHFGQKEIQSMQGPAYWARGKGSFDGLQIKEDWQVTWKD